MSFFKGVKSGLLGTDYLRDQQHASQTFVSGTMALAPKTKFAFHVFFTINTNVPQLRALYPRSDQSTIGLMVKTIQMPSFDIQTEDMNQYNRHRIVQKGIKYNPITITLHDDGQDLVRSMWRQYYAYYYADSNAPTTDAGSRNIYNDTLATHNWGYNGGSAGGGGVKPPFFSEITVYALNQKNNVGYRIVNPMIKTWQHDTYDYSAGNGTVQHQITLEYEYVQYLDRSAVIPGFGLGSPNYDSSPSPLGQAGSTTSIFGPGGVLDSAGTVLGQIAEGNILGAVLSGVRTADAANNISKAGAKEEIGNGVLKAIKSIGSGGIAVPYKKPGW